MYTWLCLAACPSGYRTSFSLTHLIQWKARLNTWSHPVAQDQILFGD